MHSECLSLTFIHLFVYLNLSQQVFLRAKAGLDPLVVGAVQLVELGDRELLFIDGAVLRQSRQEANRHVKGHGFDLPLHGLPLLLDLVQLGKLRTQHVHYLGEDGERSDLTSHPFNA